MLRHSALAASAGDQGATALPGDTPLARGGERCDDATAAVSVPAVAVVADAVKITELAEPEMLAPGRCLLL